MESQSCHAIFTVSPCPAKGHLWKTWQVFYNHSLGPRKNLWNSLCNRSRVDLPASLHRHHVIDESLFWIVILRSLTKSCPDPFGHVLRPLGSHRSEEHTSELQSRQYLVCRLLLAKKELLGSCLNYGVRKRDCGVSTASSLDAGLCSGADFLFFNASVALVVLHFSPDRVFGD